MQTCIKYICCLLCIFGIWILAGSVKLAAQSPSAAGPGSPLNITFAKPELFQKTGELSFNVVRIGNPTDSAVRIKPVLEVPQGWAVFSTSLKDTIVPPRDTIALAYRVRMSDNASSETKHELVFRLFSGRSILMAEKSCFINTEAFHNWDVVVPDKRIFFYPHYNIATFTVNVANNGNSAELVRLRLETDNKLSLLTEGEWKAGVEIYLPPYHDTVLSYNVSYVYSEDRIFDMSRVQVIGSTDEKQIFRTILVEKYSDLYSPFVIDQNLPHQAEVGIRTFTSNDELLPFFKARGSTNFKNLSHFQYNFNYYSRTGSESFESNTYYSFLYSWKNLRTGFGAFSSQLGRNIYSRHAVMFSNGINLSPEFGMQIYLSQSVLSPKTSVALGYTFQRKKISFTGSFAYDIDGERDLNTASALFRSSMIPVFKNHEVGVALYGYHENHFSENPYVLMGIAWDLNYSGKIGRSFAIQFINSYGSPDIPGPQMGLLTFSGLAKYFFGESMKEYVAATYNNSRRDYSLYNEQGIRLPEINLFDQYASLLYHSRSNPENTWEIGPSLEVYRSFRPTYTQDGYDIYYDAQKVRLEYKAVYLRNLMINIKTGFCDIYLKEAEEIRELRYDFHLMGGFGMKGFGFSFNYDYGPMVNTGLYQFAGDARNHSFNIGPSLMGNYFKSRLMVNLFTSLGYRFDLKNTMVNINPKIEAFLFRDWYLIVGGTYGYMNQMSSDYTSSSSNYYVEFAIKKRWGKSDINKWQNNTRSLKIVLFKDANGNGKKEDSEEGVPFVKTSIKLTNAPSADFSSQFPVDITLLTNEAGVVIYNRLPVGFYDLRITPLTDMKEYFYIDKASEKIELTKTTTYYIPFQKASRITGSIVMQRAQFIREGEETVDLANIKVTAYNNQGNSYSTFTTGEGTYIIYVPGNITYFVRIENVFGSRFKIARNDQMVTSGDASSTQVDFNVVEIGRQVKFKETRPVIPDSLQQAPLKIKVLHGKFYENRSDTAVDKNAVPGFSMPEKPAIEQTLIPGNFYVVLGSAPQREDAVKIWRIFDENGINAYLGFDAKKETYYVFTNYYRTQYSARAESERLKKGDVNTVEIIKVE